MASTRVYRTPASAGTRTRWTWSAWIKLAPQPANATYWGQTLFCAYSDASNYTELGIQNSGLMDYLNVTGGGTDARLTTSRMFRDPSAFYHIVAVWDSANATAGDRMKLYINGVEETAFNADTNPSSSLNSFMNSNVLTEIGSRAGGGNYFHGVMSHVQFVDNQALAPTEFGEFDATDGMWKLKTATYGTAGTNGFHLKMENSSNMDLDSSSNGHTFTTAGTLTATKDNPDNNFCTLNPLDNFRARASFSNGNTTLTTATGDATFNTSTSWLTTGKWYAEVQVVTTIGDEMFGIVGSPTINNTNCVGCTTNGFAIQSSTGDFRKDNASGTSYGSAWHTNGKIVGMFFDLDNNKIYWSVDGVLQNSGTGMDIPASTSSLIPYKAYSVAFNDGGAASGVYNFNFGNGYFGTTAITSPVEVGEGKWKYTPTGTFDSASKTFRAICTTNIKEYG